ncbi:hypothetical protein TI39_contig4202g00039 [Zymoseptoria brevis]|uniref:F-box domain-containing protein n=1 Tax=Zymoseptoria brevis TaxID=1047168 RepID=A0A0F4GAA8_9PEZI|nr:hypothetical protein TI39_contig4202g00039 [Zymoseptoria brevis]
MTSSASTSGVLDTTELLEAIVLYLNTYDMVHAKLISRHFYNTISKSSAITHELLFPTTPAGLIPFVPNPIGTHEFFVPDQDQKQLINRYDHGCLHYAPATCGKYELFWHLKLQDPTPTVIVPLGDNQQNMVLFPKDVSTRINVTNWAAMSDEGVSKQMCTEFSITVKSSRLNELVGLIEKLGKAFRNASRTVLFEAQTSGNWKRLLSFHEKEMLSEGGKLEVGFGYWWMALNNEYRYPDI